MRPHCEPTPANTKSTPRAGVSKGGEALHKPCRSTSKRPKCILDHGARPTARSKSLPLCEQLSTKTQGHHDSSAKNPTMDASTGSCESVHGASTGRLTKRREAGRACSIVTNRCGSAKIVMQNEASAPGAGPRQSPWTANDAFPERPRCRR